MTPSLPLPTDNVYKFVCLFGLTLIVVGIFSFVATYSSSLDRKIKYSEVAISLEAKAERTKSEDELLNLNKKLIEVTKANEHAATIAVSAVIGIGIVLSFFGAQLWYTKIQLRDDKLAQLQLEKAELEVAKLRREAQQATNIEDKNTGHAATGDA